MKKVFHFMKVVLLALTLFSQSALAYNAERESKEQWARLSTQLVTDVTAAGISLAAAASGNVPLAMAAGYITKYVTTYGIAGIKTLITMLKGYPPQDLGEINLAYIYLIHIKRNLYHTLMQVRKHAKQLDRSNTLQTELDDLATSMVAECEDQEDPDKCKITGLNEGLINHTFLQIALDARDNIVFDNLFSNAELKNTFHYLMLVYLDVIMAEQQLIQSQLNVLATQVMNTKKILEENVYISQAEKEYQFQMGLNILLRWTRLMDQRRVGIHESLQKTITDLEGEVNEQEEDLDGYRNRAPLMLGGVQ